MRCDDTFTGAIEVSQLYNIYIFFSALTSSLFTIMGFYIAGLVNIRTINAKKARSCKYLFIRIVFNEIRFESRLQTTLRGRRCGGLSEVVQTGGLGMILVLLPQLVPASKRQFGDDVIGCNEAWIGLQSAKRVYFIAVVSTLEVLGCRHKHIHLHKHTYSCVCGKKSEKNSHSQLNNLIHLWIYHVYLTYIMYI